MRTQLSRSNQDITLSLQKKIACVKTEDIGIFWFGVWHILYFVEKKKAHDFLRESLLVCNCWRDMGVSAISIAIFKSGYGVSTTSLVEVHTNTPT